MHPLSNLISILGETTLLVLSLELVRLARTKSLKHAPIVPLIVVGELFWVVLSASRGNQFLLSSELWLFSSMLCAPSQLGVLFA